MTTVIRDAKVSASGTARVPLLTDTQSYSAVIRDVLFANLVVLAFFQGFKARRTRMLQIQPEQLPYLGVYIIDETMTPDGDARVGDIRFHHQLKLGFQVLIQNNDPLNNELKLDQAFWAIMNGLWRNPYITNLLDTTNPHGIDNPDNTRINAVIRGTRRHMWHPGQNAETPIGELQYDATVEYFAEYGPTITDDLRGISVETIPLRDDGTIPPAGEVQRIISKYEFTP